MRRFIHNSVALSDTGQAVSTGTLQRETVSGSCHVFYACRLVNVKISAVKYPSIKFVQSDRHPRGSHEVSGSIPTGGNSFLLNLFLLFPT